MHVYQCNCKYASVSRASWQPAKTVRSELLWVVRGRGLLHLSTNDSSTPVSCSLPRPIMTFRTKGQNRQLQHKDDHLELQYQNQHCDKTSTPTDEHSGPPLSLGANRESATVVVTCSDTAGGTPSIICTAFSARCNNVVHKVRTHVSGKRTFISVL